MAISKQDVWRVADELDALAQRPTLAAVRKALGGGSFTTISEAMTEWNARRAAEKAPVIEPAPERVVETAREFAQMVWSAASELAGGRLQSERDALEVARKKFEEEQAQAAAFADQLNSELESANRRIAALAEELDQARAAHRDERDRLAGDLDQHRARAERAEATAAERADHIASLKDELDKVRSDKDQEIARLAALLAQLEATRPK